eukprot:1078110-Pelagomonas_calceolata.AAC.3
MGYKGYKELASITGSFQTQVLLTAGNRARKQGYSRNPSLKAARYRSLALSCIRLVGIHAVWLCAVLAVRQSITQKRIPCTARGGACTSSAPKAAKQLLLGGKQQEQLGEHPQHARQQDPKQEQQLLPQKRLQPPDDEQPQQLKVGEWQHQPGDSASAVAPVGKPEGGAGCSASPAAAGLSTEVVRREFCSGDQSCSQGGLQRVQGVGMQPKTLADRLSQGDRRLAMRSWAPMQQALEGHGKRASWGGSNTTATSRGNIRGSFDCRPSFKLSSAAFNATDVSKKTNTEGRQRCSFELQQQYVQDVLRVRTARLLLLYSLLRDIYSIYKCNSVLWGL